MKLRRYAILLVLFISLILIPLLYPTNEKRIKKVINNTEKAVVAEDIEGMMGHISYNYLDDYGNGYLQIKNIMLQAFQLFDDIEIEKDIIKISVKNSHAEAHVSVRVIALHNEDRGYIIGDAVSAQTIKVFLEKSPNKWLVTKVEGVFDLEKKWQ
ncbi:MAG: hypothetical protein HY752_06700 [Nitrospirae bacterium]|nr:hypothetical protein [Nitrospirota bacterium]